MHFLWYHYYYIYQVGGNLSFPYYPLKANQKRSEKEDRLLLCVRERRGCTYLFHVFLLERDIYNVLLFCRVSLTFEFEGHILLQFGMDWTTLSRKKRVLHVNLWVPIPNFSLCLFLATKSKFGLVWFHPNYSLYYSQISPSILNF